MNKNTVTILKSVVHLKISIYFSTFIENYIGWDIVRESCFIYTCIYALKRKACSVMPVRQVTRQYDDRPTLGLWAEVQLTPRNRHQNMDVSELGQCRGNNSQPNSMVGGGNKKAWSGCFAAYPRVCKQTSKKDRLIIVPWNEKVHFQFSYNFPFCSMFEDR